VAGVLRKGVLVLAFAAAAAGVAHYVGPTHFGSSQKQEQEIETDASKMTPQQRTVKRLASEAALYQRRTRDLKEDLDAKRITKEVYEQGVKDDNEQIINRRGACADAPTLAYFDALFKLELKKMGVEAPAKMPEAPKVAAPEKPADPVKPPEQTAQKKSPAPG
jgi:hypothetical protein